jgi:thiamine-phosphate pyrophosphorylase
MPEGKPECRLCLVTPDEIDLATFPGALDAALGAGDVASVIVTGMGEALQPRAEALTPVIQRHGAAAIILGDTRIAGRTRADGVHIEAHEDLSAAMESFGGKRIVGAGNVRSRHEAMSVGESEPDYLFFGRLDGDRDPEIFPRSLDLASWWSGLFEIPAILMGGSALGSARGGAHAGVEFIALRNAVWTHAAGAAAAVAIANRLLAGKAA